MRTHQAEQGFEMREVVIMTVRRPVGALEFVPDLARYQRHGAGRLGAIRRRVQERFQIPVGISLVMLALALLTPEARRPTVPKES